MVRVNVTSAGQNTSATVTPPQTYYDNLSRKWAISEEIVEGEGYSSKHYAQESKKQADIATEQAQTTTTKIEEINSATSTALNDIENKRSSAIAEVETKQNQAVSAVETAQNKAETSIEHLEAKVENTIVISATQAKNSASIATTKAAEASESAEVCKKLKEDISAFDFIDGGFAYSNSLDIIDGGSANNNELDIISGSDAYGLFRITFDDMTNINHLTGLLETVKNLSKQVTAMSEIITNLSSNIDGGNAYA